jgi:asparagine synthase (glutamine-hydrolysing)
MCGIAGIILRDGSTQVRAEDLAAMAGAMRHRGPDAEGRLLEGSVGLTMRRLAVIDLVSGDQPIWNEDRSVAVVQNGEIYNFHDLRKDLEQRGHTFTTNSDTEAIVHLYEETGPNPDLPNRLWGMFAFALFDLKRQVVVLARDRAGKKPLFLYRDGATLAFASELKAIAAVPQLAEKMAVDPAALDAYLALQYVPGPGTMFRKVRHLPPGAMLVLERNGAGWEERKERRYWSIPANPPGADTPARESFGATVERCEEILVDALRRRLVSDVPLGVFLSGGLDSSLLVALMSREAPEVLRTFSIGFEDAAYDESEDAGEVARLLNCEHSLLKMPAPGAEDLQSILGAFDQPLADPAVVPTWYLSRLAREKVTVALSGEGADEVFGGYHWYRQARGLGFGRSRGAKITPESYYTRREQVGHSERAQLLAEPLRLALLDRGADAVRDSYLASFPSESALPPMARLQAVDFTTWMADDLLVKVDRMSMAHSLEVRCPYLDHRIVEAILPLDQRYKIRWGRRKAVLRGIARRYLPARVVKRKKHGFQVPIDSLMRTTLRELLSDLTAADRLARQGLFDPDGIASLLKRWQDNPALARLVWKVLCFQVWWET